MFMLLLEALGVLLLFVFIIWWTMFSGRGSVEALHQADAPEAQAPVEQAPKP